MKKWTEVEVEKLTAFVMTFQGKPKNDDWSQFAEGIGRTYMQCYGKWDYMQKTKGTSEVPVQEKKREQATAAVEIPAKTKRMKASCADEPSIKRSDAPPVIALPLTPISETEIDEQGFVNQFLNFDEDLLKSN